MDLSEFVQQQERRERALMRVRAERAAVVRGRLSSIVRLLVEGFGVTRIALFGSLLSSELFLDSDLDLAVLGLSSDDYFRALDAVASAAGIPVDLIRFEEAPASLRERIEREGEVLYG